MWLGEFDAVKCRVQQLIEVQEYGIQWLTILPFEINAAAITIGFWPRGAEVDSAVWVAVFLFVLIVIQFFGVRGYGEVEFILSIIKVTAVVGFIILAIIIDCGGVPTQPTFDTGTKYIGAGYWYNPGAFKNGFQGFCSVFVTASFAFGGTELVGLAAAECANPAKSIPLATRQVFWRITIFYVLGLFLLGLIVPNNDTSLFAADNYTSASPFVIAIRNAGIPALPSIFNVVITISVISVANSSAYASTRTFQAMAKTGMAPKIFAYVDKAGRPIPVVLLQIAFGFLAFVVDASADAKNQFFAWLLALSGLANFFIWGSICISHMRFRAGWAAQGRSVDELPYKASFGVWGSAAGLFLVIICLMAQFYVALFPVGGSPDPQVFFQQYLAAPLFIFFYVVYKLWKREWQIWISAKDMDVLTGLRPDLAELRAETLAGEPGDKTWKTLPYRALRSLF